MSIPLKKSFYTRLSIVVIISVFLLSLFVIKIERLILFNDLNDKGESIARILSAVTLDAVLTHDYATMERYVRDIEKERFIVSVSVVRSDGELLAGTPPTEPARNTFIVEYPISVSGEDFGKVRILFSTVRVDEILRNILLAAIGIIIMLHMLGIAITNILLNRTVIRPLNKLNDAIRTVKQGNFEGKIVIDNPLEFSAIAESFNGMAKTIQSSIGNLEESRQSLSMERAKLSATLESIADGLFVTDIKGNIISFNKSAQEITGYSEREVLDRKCADVFKTTLCKDACALSHEGETITNVETSLVTEDGRRLIVAVSSAILYGMDGAPFGGVQTFRDITEDKKRHEVFCRTEKLAAIGQLAAGVAHEINNPLGNILGYAKLVREENNPENAHQWIDVIIEQTEKCNNIVKGLLDYSRSSDSELSDLDLNKIIRHVSAVLQYQMKKKNIQLHFNLSDPAIIYADEKKIEQVIFNLLMNASQAIKNNGNIWISSTFMTDSNEVVLVIKDDGHGIPGDIQCRIFDPFYTTKPVGKGTGLGLSICAGIVSELGGMIDVESKTGEGAAFRILLPVSSVKHEE